MASNKKVTIGPIGLTSTLGTNIFNPGTTTGGTNCTASPNDKLFFTCSQIRLTNNSNGAQTVTLYKGLTAGTAAGTEIMKGVSIPANSTVDYGFTGMRFNTVDFLSGGMGGGSTNDINIILFGELGVA